MAKNLSHDKWVKQQCEEYLRRQYRDVLIHASIIEGTLRNETGESTFSKAYNTLRKSGKIDPSEFRAFKQIGRMRNELVHDSFRKGYIQNQIDGLRDKLMEKILEAYRISPFLNRTLFEEYGIKRPPKIAFPPATP